MALLDAVTADYSQTAGGDLTAIENPTLESLKLRLRVERGSCFWDPTFGSTLHELPRTTIGPNILRDVEDRVRDALAPMVAAGELVDLLIQAARTDRNRVELSLRCRDAGRRPLQFSTWVAV